MNAKIFLVSAVAFAFVGSMNCCLEPVCVPALLPKPVSLLTILQGIRTLMQTKNLTLIEVMRLIEQLNNPSPSYQASGLLRSLLPPSSHQTLLPAPCNQPQCQVCQQVPQYAPTYQHVSSCQQAQPVVVSPCQKQTEPVQVPVQLVHYVEQQPEKPCQPQNTCPHTPACKTPCANKVGSALNKMCLHFSSQKCNQ